MSTFPAFVNDDRVRLVETLFESQGYVPDMVPRCQGEIPEAQIGLSLRAILDVVSVYDN